MNVYASLWQRYQILDAMDPAVGQRDAAALLGVSEVELLAVVPGCRRLRNDLQGLLSAMADFGAIRVVTGNHAAVLEQNGCYADCSLTEKVGLMLNPGGLDLRIFVRHWQSVFALTRQTVAGRWLRSVQFFDEYGDAVHKIYLPDQGDTEKWDALLNRFVSSQSASDLQPLPLPAKTTAGSVDLDQARFAHDWLALTDIHQFSGLMKKYAVSRRQAFMHAPDGYADLLATDAPEKLLRGAAAQRLPIMAFVGNRGLVQIFTGEIHQVDVIDGWLKVLDPDCTLQLRTQWVAEVWRVRRPTRDGVVTAVELLDAQGETLVTFFGQRSEGTRERAAWAALAAVMPEGERLDVE